jgi:hypothetical protein
MQQHPDIVAVLTYALTYEIETRVDVSCAPRGV